MQGLSVTNRVAERVTGASPSVPSPMASRLGRPRDVFVGQVVKRQLLLLLCIVAGCAVRAPRTDVMEPQADLPEATVKRLISVWEQQLGRYIGQEGGGDPAVLSRMQALHSRDVPRPARITFGVLDVEPNVPSRDGWDLQGLLIGKQMSGRRNWYVFVVGIVTRGGYRPSTIQDIRLAAFSAQGRKLSWEMSPADPQAVQRYRDTFRGSATVRFPGDTDRFSMNAAGGRLSVQEVRSGATWALQLGTGDSDASSHATDAAHSAWGRASAGWVPPR
jgi:hypothetical protein